MNSEEMRKMWEEAAEQNTPKNANKNAPDKLEPRGHPPRGTAAAAAREARIKTQSELYAIRKSSRSAKPSPKTDQYQYRMDDMIDRITDGPKAAARKLQAEKDKPKTEETP